MRLSRAIACGALIWVLVFFEVSVLMFGFKLTNADSMYYLIHYIALGVFVLLASLIYFRGRKIKTGFFEGLYLGLIFIIVGIVLDSIITIPLFMSMNYAFLISGGMLVGYVIGLVITMLVGTLEK